MRRLLPRWRKTMYMDCSGCFYIITVAFYLGLGFIDIIIPQKLQVCRFCIFVDDQISEKV